jgi:hypothetical protein
MGSIRWRKRPVEVEAVQFTGGNLEEVQAFCPSAQGDIPDLDCKGWRRIVLPMPKWDLVCDMGAWVIKGPTGEFSLCTDEIFRRTYQPIA